MNLSVSHPLDSRSPFGTFVPPPPAGGVFPGRGAIDKEISFRSNTRCCDKTSPPQSLPLSGEALAFRRVFQQNQISFIENETSLPRAPLVGKTPPAGGGGTQVPKGERLSSDSETEKFCKS